jgi:hypothetical protein
MERGCGRMAAAGADDDDDVAAPVEAVDPVEFGSLPFFPFVPVKISQPQRLTKIETCSQWSVGSACLLADISRQISP